MAEPHDSKDDIDFDVLGIGKALSEAYSARDDDESYGNYGLPSTSEIRVPWIGIVLLLAVIILGSIGLYALLKALVVHVFEIDWVGIYRFLSNWYGQIVGTATLLTVGGAMYRLRSRWRAWYGTIELGFATMVAWASTGKLSEAAQDNRDGALMAAWIAVGTAGYLVVRGLDNLMEGLRVKKRQPGSTDGGRETAREPANSLREGITAERVLDEH